MTIYHGSRYEYEPLDRVTDANGNQQLTIFPRSLGERYNNQPWSFTQYVVVDGDRLDLLAFRYYGRADLWWLIADANPEIFHPVDDLKPGIAIRIPDYRPIRRVELPANTSLGGLRFLQGSFGGTSLR